MGDIFEYEIKNGKCTITGYKADDAKECRIPDVIEDAPVTDIARYAFSEHRELVSVELPRELVTIGAHAFYNCRSLCQIKMYDGITDMGDGAFKNCAMVYKAEITRVKGSMKCLKALMDELNQELRIEINYDDGRKAVVVFPYYMYEYEENTPGRIINQVTIGSGVHYRECIGGSDINYVQYDRIFNVEKNIDVNESAWKVAYWRLRFPYMLSEESHDMYASYVHTAVMDIAKAMMRSENYEELTALLDIAASERSEVSAIVEAARDMGMIKAVGVLLEYEKGRWHQSRKKYEF